MMLLKYFKYYFISILVKAMILALRQVEDNSIADKNIFGATISDVKYALKKLMNDHNYLFYEDNKKTERSLAYGVEKCVEAALVPLEKSSPTDYREMENKASKYYTRAKIFINL